MQIEKAKLLTKKEAMQYMPRYGWQCGICAEYEKEEGCLQTVFTVTVGGIDDCYHTDCIRNLYKFLTAAENERILKKKPTPKKAKKKARRR